MPRIEGDWETLESLEECWQEELARQASESEE